MIKELNEIFLLRTEGVVATSFHVKFLLINKSC